MKNQQQIKVLLFQFSSFFLVPIAFFILIIVLLLIAPTVVDTEN